MDIAISGFSGGAGKTFLARKIIEFFGSSMEFSISYTTRKPRGHEQEGKDYYFVDVQTFEKMIEDKLFLECSNPRDGIYYGTSTEEYDRIKKQGKAVIFDVDYKGILQIKRKMGESVFALLLMPDVDTRKLWMEKRGGMTPEEMEQRIVYSETCEKPFFERDAEFIFDKILNPYRNDIDKVPFLVNEIANLLVVRKPVAV
ncbi:MAG: Guanylate kinase [Candidatus Nomurabacteria bacterium]|nr:Guanylate kinase [Candidatus Nomurabacteria bacterium]